MWAGAGAAVSVVAEGVDVHATLSIGVVAGDVPLDRRGRGLGFLGEGDGALDVGVTTENCDCCRTLLAHYLITLERSKDAIRGPGTLPKLVRSPILRALSITVRVLSTLLRCGCSSRLAHRL